MPNWCENVMVVSGSEEELDRFQEFIRSDESEFDFNKVIPEPGWNWEPLPGGVGQICKEEREFDVSNVYGAEQFMRQDAVLDEVLGKEPVPIDLTKVKLDWYNWRLLHWGTKWSPDKDFIVVSREEGKLTYNFDTAWSPPSLVIKALGKEFPTLRIKLYYEEPGCAFFGAAVAEGDKFEDKTFEMTALTHPDYYMTECGRCGEEYNHGLHEDCPHCNKDHIVAEATE